MNKRLLTLVLAVALGFPSLAMAGDLGSVNSEFLFGSTQVAATTISEQEMQTTQGQLHEVLVPLLSLPVVSDVAAVVAGLPVLGPVAVTVVGLLAGIDQ
jgi:cytochrome b561